MTKDYKKYYLKHKEKYKKYYQKNKERILKQQSEYAKNNKEIRNAAARKRYKLKMKDPYFRLMQSLRARIRMALKGTNKSKKTMHILGIPNIEFLWKHLEKKFQPGMTRENYGEWHIDHIKSCASFNLNDPKEQEICFHYENLQPLWAYDNKSKGKN